MQNSDRIPGSILRILCLGGTWHGQYVDDDTGPKRANRTLDSRPGQPLQFQKMQLDGVEVYVRRRVFCGRQVREVLIRSDIYLEHVFEYIFPVEGGQGIIPQQCLPPMPPPREQPGISCSVCGGGIHIQVTCPRCVGSEGGKTV